MLREIIDLFAVVGVMICAFALCLVILVANDVVRNETKKWRR